jgi:hypothetical protein
MTAASIFDLNTQEQPLQMILPDGRVVNHVLLFESATNRVRMLPETLAAYIPDDFPGLIFTEQPEDYHYHRKGPFTLLVLNSFCVGGCRDPHPDQVIQRHNISTYNIFTSSNFPSKCAQSLLSEEMMK